MSIGYDQNSFLARARSVHGDLYDYAPTNYKGCHNKIEINCRKHGGFHQNPTQHLTGQGCPACGLETRIKKTVARNRAGVKSQDDFLNRARQKHDSMYDYSKTSFQGLRSRVTITCSKHGDFEQMAQTHIINGQGCPHCFRERAIEPNIRTARQIYGDKYDYSECNINTMLGNKHRIICPDHGPFYCRLSDHASEKKRQGCKKCGYNTRKNNHGLLTQQDFINRSIKAHGSRYTYDDVFYKGIAEKVVIICSIHGAFKQAPREHWAGSGCQKCANNSSSRSEQAWLDQIGVPIEQRNQCVQIGKRRFYADGLDEENKIVYEFMGDYWHGNPSKYDAEQFNQTTKTTFGELHRRTFERFDRLEKAGYKIISIWESDWLAKKSASPDLYGQR